MRRASQILGMSFAMLIAAQPAMSMTWGPNSTWYDGTKRATGSGDFFNRDNTYAVNRIKVEDDKRDGNSVYGYTEFFFLAHGCDHWDSCGTDFKSAGRSKTPEFQNATRTYELNQSLAPTGTKARAKTFVCVQMGWPVPDGCAPAAYPSFDY